MREGKIAATLLVFAVLSWSATAERSDSKLNMEVETVVQKKDIPFTTIYQFSRDMSAGRIRKAKDGTPGQVVKTYKVVVRDNKTISRKLVSTERVEPKPTVFEIGRSGFKTSRGAFTVRSVKTMNATAYMPYDGISRNGPPLTKLGIVATYGCIAVDPRVIPLGTWLYVEGYGVGYACDTGGAIKGNIIDVCVTDRRTMYNWGRRKVKVHILSAK
jgi:3D (Asp-Asp-Asp) domain-containing protein